MDPVESDGRGPFREPKGCSSVRILNVPQTGRTGGNRRRRDEVGAERRIGTGLLCVMRNKDGADVRLV